jgi:hypothetical protein
MHLCYAAVLKQFNVEEKMITVSRFRVQVVVLLVVVLLLSPSANSQKDVASQKRLSPSEIDQILLAVQDEIYDYGYQDEFWGFATSGEKGKIAQYNVYVTPIAQWNSNSWQGQIIYKYPPFGEIIRSFFIGKDMKSLVALGSTPGSGFSWNQPDTQTIYADDDEICKFKQTWLKTSFSFELEPSPDVLKQAYSRQVRRKGVSHYGKKPPEIVPQ